MSAVGGGGGNYISDAAIMSWLAVQQGRIYDDLRESMDLAQQRANFTDDLNTLKAQLQEANENKDFGKVNEELQKFLEMHREDPQFEAICSELEGMAKTIADDVQIRVDYDQQVIDYRNDFEDYHALVNAIAQGKATGPAGDPPERPGSAPPPQQYSDERLKAWTDLISGKVDGLGRNDQLTMIHIQELKATLDQGAQLGSSFISSGDKTSSAIINNIA